MFSAPDVTLLGSPLDPDAARWIATVGPANVSQPRGRLISDTIRELKAANVWADLDYLGVYTAENAASALTDWKARKTGTETASPTFTTDRGYAFDGLTNYIDANFIPSSECVAATGTSHMGGVYERTNVASNGIATGSQISGTRTIRIIPRNASDQFAVLLNAVSVNVGTSITDSRGLSAAASDGVNATGFKNGVQLLTAALTTPGATLTSRTLFVGCYNATGSPTGFRASTIGLMVFGANMGAARQLAFYTIMQRYMIRLGANV